MRLGIRGKEQEGTPCPSLQSLQIPPSAPALASVVELASSLRPLLWERLQDSIQTVAPKAVAPSHSSDGKQKHKEHKIARLRSQSKRLVSYRYNAGFFFFFKFIFKI